MKVDTSAPVVVRLAGLSTVAVANLKSEEMSARLRRHLADRDWLVSEGAALSEALHPVVPTVRDAAVRRGLIGLRRAAFQARAPRRSEWGPLILAALPADLRERARHWRGRVTTWVRRHTQLSHVLDRDTTPVRALREAAADPGFQRALWLASPALAEELDKWLADPRRQPRRQVLFRLAKYVARAATRTSPFSSFLVSGFGSWVSTGPPVRVDDQCEPTGVLELHEPVREHVVTELARHPSLRHAMIVQVNPSLTIDRDQFRFLGPPPREQIVAVPASPAVKACLHLLPDGTPVTVGELGDRLGALAGDPPAAARLISRLLEFGVLQAFPPEPDAAGATAGLARWVTMATDDRLAPVARTVTALHEQTRTPSPVADLGGYRKQQESLADVVNSLTAAIGATTVATREPVAMDTVVAAGRLARLGVPAWRAALDDLAAVLRWQAVFNPALPLRLALAEMIQDGQDLPYIDLHCRVQQEIAAGTARGVELRRLLSPAPAPPATWLSPRIGEYEALRRAAMRPVREALVEDGTAKVDPAALVRLAAGWPPWVEPPESLGCYVQVCGPPGEAWLVLNMVGTGFGKGGSRLAHLLARAGGQPPPHLAEYRAATAVPAALNGAHGSTLNERQPSVPYEIDYPFTAGEPRSVARLPLNDLVVRRDPATGLLRLRSARLDAPVRALDLTLMEHTLLPPAARLLVEAFGETPMKRGQLSPRAAGEAGPARSPHPVPRVMVGRVVLRRACWLVDAAHVPRRRSGEKDADYLLRLAGWARDEGVPPRFFVRSLTAAGGRQRRGIGSAAVAKPTYLDLESPLLVNGFDNLLGSLAGTLSFEEALPDPEEAIDHVGAPRTVELLVELSGTERDDG